MQSFTSPREELSDRRLGARCSEQLKVRIADREHRFFDPLIFDSLAMTDFEAPNIAVMGDSGVEIADRESDVLDPAQHEGRNPTDPVLRKFPAPIGAHFFGKTRLKDLDVREVAVASFAGREPL